MVASQRLIILGSTGSIGTTALDVIRDFPDRFRAVGLAAGGNTRLLAEQVEEFRPDAVCIADANATAGMRPADANALQRCNLFTGEDGLVELVRRCAADTILVATTGLAGLAPTLAAIDLGLRVALANKETLVVAGEIVMDRARRGDVEILPVDSEHNAIFQCMAGNARRNVRRFLLTASGGPFLNCTSDELRSVTPSQALAHPTWEMGRKISVDSATLMNKGLEVIEACHLFDIRPERVEVLIHPQSAVHSMVEFSDGSVLAQMGETNMYLPILNALAYPERLANKHKGLDLAQLGSLDFALPDRERFPCLGYAYEAAATGGCLPAAMNAANEVAVQAFLDGKIDFPGIARTVRAVMDLYLDDKSAFLQTPLDLTTLRQADRLARETARQHAGLSA